MMEYDVDIKITKLVRGKGLCEYLADEPNKETMLVNDVAAADNQPASWLK